MSKSLIKRFILINSIFAAMLLFADESTPGILSNEEVARQIIVEPVLQQLFKEIPDSAILTFLIKETNAELSGWTKQNLVDSCIAHGYAVYDEVDSIPGSFEIIEIRSAEISFEYKSSGKKWLFLNKGYKRIVNCEFHISITKNTGKIIFSKRFSNIFEDIVPNIKMVENKRLSFTKGKKLDSSITNKLIEPVLITASAATVVYLFYSLRSGN